MPPPRQMDGGRERPKTKTEAATAAFTDQIGEVTEMMGVKTAKSP
jgi:hypothetical protein